MYVVIEWFGEYPSFVLDENGDVAKFSTQESAHLACEECQQGQVIECPEV